MSYRESRHTNKTRQSNHYKSTKPHCNEQFKKRELKLVQNCGTPCNRNGNMLFEIEVVDELGRVLQSVKVQNKSTIRFAGGDIEFQVGQQNDTVLVVPV